MYKKLIMKILNLVTLDLEMVLLQFLYILKFNHLIKWSYGLRLEYIAFDDFVTDNVITPTLTVNYQVGDLTIKPELRLDMSEEDIFMNNDGDATANLSSFVLGAVYSF